MSANRAASIRARLRDAARERGEEFNLTLNRYAVERYLYRLSVSRWAEQFVLKGALLFDLWFDEPHRPTRDADFLGFGPDDAATAKAIVTDICAIDVDDGIEFDPAAAKIEEIREDAHYGGLRVRISGRLDGALCTAQIDIGFGDAVTPGPLVVDYPTILDDVPAPRLRVYPRESVMSEKLESIVSLGMGNSRMKDYYDLRALIRDERVDERYLVDAIRATFDRRRTRIPGTIPVGLSDEFANSPAKIAQWRAFLDRNRLEGPALADVVTEIRTALDPSMRLARASAG